MRRAKYLQDMDKVQDAITKLKEATIKDIMTETRLSYSEVQQAAYWLRNLGRVNHEYRGRTITYSPN